MSEPTASSDLLRARGSDGDAHWHLLEREGGGGSARVSPADEPATPLTLECAAIGAALGATLGVLAATLLTVASLTLLGVEMAGPLAAAGLGGLLGAALGALVGRLLEVHAMSRSTEPTGAGGASARGSDATHAP
jgi:hypothetical protein